MAVADRAAPLRDPNFRLLWAGEAVAVVAEQLFLVTLTLLVLDVAGPGAALGTVLAVAAVPRALLLPFGGVLVDRLAPSVVAVVTTWVRMGLLVTLAVLVALGPPPIWAIALMAALLGVLDAAYYPASLSLLPTVVPPAGLPAANALVQGAESAGDLIGPALAAALVAGAGLSGALGVVGVLYALAAIALTVFARRVRERRAAAVQAPSAPALAALREGLRFAWSDPVVRVVLLVLVALNVAVVGPALVGGAVLADERLGGPEQLGFLFAAFGAGSLSGLIGAAVWRPRRRGLVLIAGMAAIGVALGGFGLAQGLLAVLPVAALMGLGAGYLGVVLVAWLQERVPEAMRGRVMSLVAFCAVALDPLSYALAGALVPVGLTALFGVAGGLVLACAAVALLDPRVRGLR